ERGEQIDRPGVERFSVRIGERDLEGAVPKVLEDHDPRPGIPAMDGRDPNADPAQVPLHLDEGLLRLAFALGGFLGAGIPRRHHRDHGEIGTSHPIVSPGGGVAGKPLHRPFRIRRTAERRRHLRPQSFEFFHALPRVDRDRPLFYTRHHSGGIVEICNNILEAIGRTPLVRLNKLVGPEDATVLVKCEFLNPGGAIKDRIAVHIIDKAEKEGLLEPGGTIVENTSGNTGAALAMVAAGRGYKGIFTMPDKMSKEKIDTLRARGAEVGVTPTAVPADSPESYYETAKRIARETPNTFYVNQYHSLDNVEAHYLTTGPEIWEQTGGKIDAFVAGLGTGG